MRLVLLVIVVLVFVPLLLQFNKTVPSPDFSTQRLAIKDNEATKSAPYQAVYHEQFASTGATHEVHSAVFANLADGNLRAFWYGGEREGAKNVSIFTAELDVASNQWSDEKVVVERLDMSQQLGIYLRKIGNPVAMLDSEGRVWLFFVTVSVGGWGGSSINFITSEDSGENWSEPTRLVTSPILNLSTLVKGKPFLYQDGTIGLPVYHEMIGKFGELLHLSKTGEVLDKQRLTSGRSNLQPIVLVEDGQNAKVYLRNSTDAADSTLFVTETTDAGRSWAEPRLSKLPNPNAAVTGLRLASGEMLMVINNQYDKRNKLSLMYSNDNGQTWQMLHELEQKDNTAEIEYQFSYPALRQSSDGQFHVLYTWKKKRIKHVSFNWQWLSQRIKE